MKRYANWLLGVLAVVAAIAIPAALAGNGQPAPKATGDITFNVGQAGSMEFNAIQTSETCSASDSWNVTGSWVIDYTVGGPVVSTYDVTLAQTGTSVTSGSFVQSGGPYVQSLTAGSVTGTDVSLTTVYTATPDAVPAVTTYLGTIHPDGSMSGTWTDNYPPPDGARSGTWATTSGAATQVFAATGCNAKGTAHLSYADGSWYDVNVIYVNVSGADAWFAGVVTASSPTIGHLGGWVTFQVHDGGEPGITVDNVWGSWSASEAAARLAVAQKTTPVDGPFPITGGNLQVH